MKKRVETTISEITKMFSRIMHVFTLEGFGLQLKKLLTCNLN